MNSNTLSSSDQHAEHLAVLSEALGRCITFAELIISLDGTKATELLDQQIKPVIDMAATILDQTALDESAVKDFLPSAKLLGHACFVYNQILELDHTLMSTFQEIPDIVSVYAVVVRIVANDLFSLQDNHCFKPVIETTVQNLDRLTREWTERIEFTKSSGFPEEFMAMVPTLRDLSEVCSEKLRSILSAFELSSTLSLDDRNDESRNLFEDINMGEETMLALMSPDTPGTFRNISSGTRAMQVFYVSIEKKEAGNEDGKGGEEQIMKMLSTERAQGIISKCSRGYSLVPVSTNSLQNVVLKEGEVMFILSGSKPVRVKNVEGRAGSVLVAGVIPLPMIRRLANLFQMDINTDELDGIFHAVSHNG